ncbi:MAG TPA: ATPase inhibitor subunit zeta [Candidatus Sulfotelmatobacter sp.]|jgi:hypothetical protein|nr:ATPase inhibitor subunit zeta [Candidatus Sulfotelmatobacter sp.]
MSAPNETQEREPGDLIHQRNRLAGLWAAELLGLFGQAAHDYARAVMHPGHDEQASHGDDAEEVTAKLSHDLAGRVGMAEIRSKMAHFLEEARHLFQGRP